MDDELKEIDGASEQREELLGEVQKTSIQEKDSLSNHEQNGLKSPDQSFWGVGSETQSVIQGSTTKFEQTGAQVVFLQPPSSAPKIIAILCIILASFGVIGSLLGFFAIPTLGDSNSDGYIPEFEWYKEVAYVNIFSELVGSIVLILGSIMLLKKKKLGVYVILGSIGLGLLRDLIMNTTYPEFAAAAGGGINATVLSAVSMSCSIFCSLVAVIPLMIQNNGLE